MGALLSRNSVAPQQTLAVVASASELQPIKAVPTTKPKRHKPSTLVPEPLNKPHLSDAAPAAKRQASDTPAPTRAELRVQFLKAVKRGDTSRMAALLELYNQCPRRSQDPSEDEDDENRDVELVNVRGMWESTPLISATQYAHEKAAVWLLERGAEPHAKNEKGVTALLLASLEGLCVVVERLLGPSFDVSTLDGQTGVVYNAAADVNVRLSPLLAASMNGHEAIVRLLLERGAAINQQLCIASSSNAPGNSTALQLAARYGHSAVVALLLEHGADCSLLDSATDSSALLLACEHGHEDSALLLFNAMNLGSEARDSGKTRTEGWQTVTRQGFTALHFAAVNGLLGVCRTLLNALKTQQHSLEDEVIATAFIDARAGARQETALLLAARKRRHEVVRVLLEAGADAEVTDRGGNTATQVLTRNKQNELLQLCEARSKSRRQSSTSVPTDSRTSTNIGDDLSLCITTPRKEEEVRVAETHTEPATMSVQTVANGDG